MFDSAGEMGLELQPVSVERVIIGHNEQMKTSPAEVPERRDSWEQRLAITQSIRRLM